MKSFPFPWKKKVSVVVHSGEFHADDLFSAATLSLALKDPIRITRTRDPQLIAAGDFVIDVGGEYDDARNRFDHHQIGGAGARENGIPYATFGLVWKKYGVALAGSQKAADIIDKKLVAPIDASDNGVALYEGVFPGYAPYHIEQYFQSFRPTWKEDRGKMDEIFLRVMEIAKSLLAREIDRAKSSVEAEEIVERAYREAPDKRLIVLEGSYPWGSVIEKYPEPLYVTYPQKEEGNWRLYTVRVANAGFKNRKDLPESWAGRRDGELAAITGVPDATFCHTKRFLAVTRSKEGALQLAELALKA